MSFAGIIRESLKGLNGKELTIFLHILINCNHSDNPDFKFDNKVISLKRGDWICSIPKLKELTGYSDQQIRTSLKNLSNLTYILTDNLANRGRKISVININNFLYNSDELTDKVTDSITDNQQTANRPLTINKKNNNDINNDSKKNVQNIYTQQFENFWKQYPKKKGKGAAFKAYLKAIKNVSHEEIMQGVLKYSEAVLFTDDKYIKYPQGWLNDGRWDDDYSKQQSNGEKQYANHKKPTALQVITAINDRTMSKAERDEANSVLGIN